MVEETIVITYLENGGASMEEIDDFIDWCTQMCIMPGGNGNGKRRRFWIYRMWARLLRNRKTPFPSNGKFAFDEKLKKYLRNMTGGDVSDPPNPREAIYIRDKDFVKYVVRRLDNAY